jgi:hypothetical protein
MGLGIAFGLKRPDGGLSVVEVDAGGPVAAAGGRVGDVWLTIAGVPVVEVIDGWLAGTRVRTPDVPIMVRIERAGVGMTIAPVESAEREAIKADVALGFDPGEPRAGFPRSLKEHLEWERTRPRAVTRADSDASYDPFRIEGISST